MKKIINLKQSQIKERMVLVESMENNHLKAKEIR